jgi:hypothetical protein
MQAKLLDVAQDKEGILDLTLFNEVLKGLVFYHEGVDLSLLL